MSQPIKIEVLRELIASGAVKSATILGQKGGYALLANVGMKQRLLGTRDGDVRLFGSVDTVVKALSGTGLVHYQVDMSNYEKGLLRKARPDLTAKAKAASTALAHDRWFRDQVTETLAKDERGEATWHDHDAMWDTLEAQAVALVAAKSQKPEAKAAKPARPTSTRRRQG